MAPGPLASTTDVLSAHLQHQEFAYQSLDHFRLFLRGPPNKRTQDATGLLPIVLSFLDDLKAGGGLSAGF